MFDQNSSNSDENIGFDGLTKKVDYAGDISDSDQQQSESQQVKKKARRKNYSKRISSLLYIQGAQTDKTKNIKKNCQSAKQSRQRKKIYIESLQKIAEQLKKQIINRKVKIANNRDAIMIAIKQSNPQKSRFISEYLEDNKNLAKQMAKIKSLNQSQTAQKGEKGQKPEKEQKMIEKNQKADKLQKQDKQLQHMINSYLYKFGFTGVLRRDVLQQLKMKWYELAIDQNIIMNGHHIELKTILEKFKSCMNQLEKKGLQLEYLFRNLQYNLNQQDIVKFIINPQFLLQTQNKKLDLAQIKASQQHIKAEQKNEKNS